MENDDKSAPIPMEDALQGGLFGADYAPSGKRGAPSSSRASVAERKRRFLAAQAEIGEIPAVADPARRARCEASLVEFAREYCMGTLLAREPSPRMVEYAEHLQAAICGTGFTHVRFPRGAGKTTWIKAAIAWGVATGRLRFPVIFCASADLASSALADIWAVFESPTFAADFPEISYPILSGGGSAQRWLSQTCGGVRTHIKKTAREIRLPTVEGSKASGAVIRARGAGGSTRGMVAGSMRPDYVLLDDIQTKKDSDSEARVKKLASWIEGDVLGLGGARQVVVTMASTPIRKGDLSETFADSDLHPEWKLFETPLVISWPIRENLWERYDDLWRQARREGDTQNTVATAFYEANREAMDEGGEVLDPGAFDPMLERSGLQHARNLLLSQGRAAFDAEYQLVTASEQQAVVVTPKLVASRVNGAPRLVLPRECSHLYAFVDVNAGDGISWSVTGFGRKRVAAVVDYGRHPGGNRRLVEKNTPLTVMQKLVAKGLAEVLDRLLELRVPREDGGPDAVVEEVWIDTGFLPDTVHAVAAVRSKVRRRRVCGCYGRANVVYLTHVNGKNVTGRASGVTRHEEDGRVWYEQNSDVWKETAQRAFLAEPRTPGSLSIFGTSKTEHYDYAIEVCSETLDEKLESKRGDVYRWTKKPTAKNHWFDTTGGCFAIASWNRSYASEAATVNSATMPARTLSAVRRRARAGFARRASTISL